MDMKVEEILHVKGGAGQDSYANNSLLQKAIITKSKPALEESLREAYSNTTVATAKCIRIAELGCSSGPNALAASLEIIAGTYTACRSANIPVPEFQLSLNDLPGTDFNNLFSVELPKFHQRLKELEKENHDYHRCSCYVAATPGSYFGRLFPNNSLHFVHASSSLHFLSKVPEGLVSGNGVALNKGTIYIAESSSSQVHKAYHEQFVDDFTMFLTSRANEVVPGGRMVLTFRITNESDQPHYWWDFQFLDMALKQMVQEGLIKEENLDEFNFPIYFPTIKEVKELIKAEGSFTLHKFETFWIDWGDPINMRSNRDETVLMDLNARAKFVECCYKAAIRSIMAVGFGEAIIDDLFFRFKNIVLENLMVGNLNILNHAISLAKK